jgi:hypothetical protein
MPQPPQLLSSLTVSMHAPPSTHRSRPVVHTHVELSQIDPVPQAFPQALQLFLSCAVSVQTPLQSVVGARHVQVLFWQTVPPVHAMLQALQLSELLVRSTHAPAQFVRPGAHVVAHAPALHTWPGLHLVTHAPQC